MYTKMESNNRVKITEVNIFGNKYKIHHKNKTGDNFLLITLSFLIYFIKCLCLKIVDCCNIIVTFIVANNIIDVMIIFFVVSSTYLIILWLVFMIQLNSKFNKSQIHSNIVNELYRYYILFTFCYILIKIRFYKIKNRLPKISSI